MQTEELTEIKEYIKENIGISNKVKEVLLYVHGFNTNQEDAKKSAFEIYNATNKHVIVYDWNSNKRKCFSDFVSPAFFYCKDSETSFESTRSLSHLLYLLSRGMDRVHIVSHSMGSRIVIEAINSISHDYRVLRAQFRKERKSGQSINDISGYYQKYNDILSNLGVVVFKQPDVDVQSMCNLIMFDMATIADAKSKSNNYSDNTHIYSHNDDQALDLSKKIHNYEPRVGSLPGANILKQRLKGHKCCKEHNNDLHFTYKLKKETRERKPAPCIIVFTDGSKFSNMTWYKNPFVYNFYGNHQYFTNKEFKKSLNKIFSLPDVD